MIDNQMTPNPMAQMLGKEPAIEIEIEDPESVKIGIDGVEIEIEPGKDSDEDFDANLADLWMKAILMDW
jgi:hypothetical protein